MGRIVSFSLLFWLVISYWKHGTNKRYLPRYIHARKHKRELNPIINHQGPQRTLEGVKTSFKTIRATKKLLTPGDFFFQGKISAECTKPPKRLWQPAWVE